jgi:hypothetical protein
MTNSGNAYREAGWLSSRIFQLDGDTIVIRRWGFGGWQQTAEVRLRLADLDPQTAAKSWVRRSDQHTVLLGGLVVLILVMLAILAMTTSGRSERWLVGTASMVGGLLLVAAFAALDPRRVEYVHFNHTSGLYALTVGKLGPETERYEAFVLALVEAIRASRAAIGRTQGAG